MPSSNRPLAWAAAVTALALAPARAGVMEDTVATVDGTAIMLSEYQKNVETVLEQYRRTAPMLLGDKETLSQIRRKVLDQMVDDALLHAEAVKRGVKVHEREVDGGVAEVKERNFRRDETGKTLTDEEIDKTLNAELKKEGLTPSLFRERIRKQLMIRRVIDEVVRARVTPPEEKDVRKAYERVKFLVKADSNTVAALQEGAYETKDASSPLAGLAKDDQPPFAALASRIKDLTSERVRVAHLLLKVEPKATLVEKNQVFEKARKLKKEIEDGGDFDELARKESEDKESAERGGDIGFILRGWMPPAFEKAAFSLPVGELSDPIETQFGYHLLRVQEKKAAESPSFDKLKDDLGQFLFNMGFQRELERLAKELRSKAHIETKLPKD